MAETTTSFRKVLLLAALAAGLVMVLPLLIPTGPDTGVDFEQFLSSGQLLTGSLMDYCVPRADQLPPMRATFDESVPCQTNLLGVKGCGELGTIGAVPAVVHAVLDAIGAPHLEMPLTAEKVWRALRGRR